MSIIRYLKPGFFIYECFRMTVLAFTLVYLLPGTTAIPWITIAASQALFPLMALFICLDTVKYKAFLPLFIAGKSIGIISILGRSMIFGHIIIVESLGMGNYSIAIVLAELILPIGDFFSLVTAYLLKRTEDKQCE